MKDFVSVLQEGTLVVFMGDETVSVTVRVCSEGMYFSKHTHRHTDTHTQTHTHTQ